MHQQLHLSSDIGLSLDVASKYALDMIRCFQIFQMVYVRS